MRAVGAEVFEYGPQASIGRESFKNQCLFHLNLPLPVG